MGKAQGAIVLSTFSSEALAAGFGKKMVELGLCACVNFTRVRSIYAWKGKVEYREEYIAFFKATRDSAGALKEALAKAHPYEVPEIVELKVSDVSKPYLSWLESSAKRVAKKRDHAAKR